ncbi:hypothetical protein INR49_015859 [Caranx melampygus]|nr:hypothetical protein INR49_015859 [Caranx melampygus]
MGGMMMDLSEWQREQRESFSDVYLKVLTPVYCSEQTVTDLTETPVETCTGADTEIERERKTQLRLTLHTRREVNVGEETAGTNGKFNCQLAGKADHTTRLPGIQGPHRLTADVGR